VEFVTVRHPAIAGTAEVSRAAFDATYQEKGWVIVGDESAAAPVEQPLEQAPAPEQPADPAPEPPVETPAEQPADPAPSDTPIGDGIATTPIQPEV
jgi:hypothetical protein